MKKLISLLAILLVLATFALPVSAASPRLADRAGLLSGPECAAIEKQLDAAAATDQAAADAAAAAGKALVGVWLQRDSDWEDTYIFNADGTGMLISGPEYPFTYSVSGDTLTLDYGDDDEEEFTFSVDGDF